MFIFPLENSRSCVTITIGGDCMFIATIFTLLIPLILFYFIKLFLLFIKREVKNESCDKVCDILIKVAKAIMKFCYILLLFMVLVSFCNVVVGV